MARQVGGGDNIMGSKEAIVNVSFKDDLGNILENASQLKDILDSVNQNFLAINSAVGITTQTMGKLASQTQRLVATTQQLRNEYQTIADASQRIGLSQSISPPSSIFQNTDVVRDALSGTGGARGLVLPGGEDSGMAFGSTAGFKELMTETYMSRPRRTQAWNQVPGTETRSVANVNRRLSRIQKILSDKSIQLTPEQRTNLEKQESNLKLDLPDHRDYTTVFGKKIRIPDPVYFRKDDEVNNPLETSVPGQIFEDWQSGASTSAIVRGVLGSFGGPTGAFLSAAIPYITAGIGVGVALYKSADYLVKGATRYSGLTGGTGVFDNDGAAEGSSTFLGLQGRAWWEGLRNMAVGPGGYQAIQESLLGAGYTARDDSQYNKLGIRGLRYEGARSFLVSMYSKGLQDIDQNLQLMQMVVERGGGSLTTLTGTIDNLRETALTTNTSLKVMMSTLATSMAGLIGGMNVQGNIAAFVGGNNAAAYANSQNTLLRGSGAPNYNDFITQMTMLQSPSFSSAGVNANNYFYMMAHPELFPGGQEGMAIAKATDYMADRLFRFPVPKGTSLERAKDIISQNSNYVRQVMQSPMFKAAVADPNIYNSVDASIEWLARNAIGDPQTETAEANKAKNLAHEIPGRTITRDLRTSGDTYSPRNRTAIKRPGDPDEYLRKTFGTETSLLGKGMMVAGYGLEAAGLVGALVGSAATGGALLPGVPLAMVPGAAMVSAGRQMEDLAPGPAREAYYDYVRATNKSAGWAERVLKNPDATTAGRTYVKYGDEIIGFKRFMEMAQTDKAIQAAMEGKGKTLYIGEKEKGEDKSDITKWTESGEFGGGGGLANKPLMDMSSTDFADAVTKGLRKFNDVSAGLRVRDA